jgi:creatinine amidohydrolase
MSWPEVERALADGYDTVVIFTGSIEQHGPHLPLATDTILGYAIGERVARRLGNALLAPVIRPGVSEHHMAFKGTLTISPDTFKATVRDVAHSLARHGFKRIAITWSHGGNAGALTELLPQLAAELPDVEIRGPIVPREKFKHLAEYARTQGITLEALGIHAGEGETSEMLAHAPDQVRRNELVQGFMGDLVSGEGEHAKLLREGLHRLTSNGVLGDARLADAARGERYLDLVADYIVAHLVPVTPSAATKIMQDDS